MRPRPEKKAISNLTDDATLGAAIVGQLPGDGGALLVQGARLGYLA
jgi:hypothetical protein